MFPVHSLLDRWKARFIRGVIRRRRAVLTGALVLTALAAILAARTEFDSSLEVWFLEDDPAMVSYRQFREQFGADEFVVVGLLADDVFQPDFLRKLDRFTAAAAKLHYVRSANSLATASVLEPGDSYPRARPLIEAMPAGADEVEAIRRKAMESPLIAGRLVSPDGRATAVVVRLTPDCDDFREKVELVGGLRQLVGEILPGVETRLAGIPVVNDGLLRYARGDMLLLTPLAAAVIVGLMWVLFRTWAAPLLALLVVGLAALWVIGTMGLAGLKLDILSSTLVLVILVVGVADSIHILAAYARGLAAGLPRRRALRQGMSDVITPCIFTSITTVAGFLSLLTTNLEPIRHFGILSALGTAFALLLSMTLLPALLLMVPFRRPARRATGVSRLEERLLQFLAHPSRRRSWATLAVSAALLAPALLLVSTIQVTANPMRYFRPGDPIRTEIEAIDDAFGGSATIELLVHAPDRGLMKAENLRKLDELQRWLEERPAVTHTLSVVDALKEVERVRGGEAKLPSPARLGLVLRMMHRRAPELFGSLVREDYSVGRISVRVRLADADMLAAQAPRIEQMLREKYNTPELHVEATGFVKLIADMRTYLVGSQMRGIGASFVVITLIMSAMLRSLRLGAFAMIPNVIPIVIGLALMGLLNIRLDPGTVMVATVALGLVVDDTTHFIVRLKAFAGKGEPIESAIAHTMRETGRPIVLTSVILAGGFAMLLLGSFSPTFYFGLLSAMVILIALLAELLILPAALIVIRPRLTPACDSSSDMQEITRSRSVKICGGTPC